MEPPENVTGDKGFQFHLLQFEQSSSFKRIAPSVFVSFGYLITNFNFFFSAELFYLT